MAASLPAPIADHIDPFRHQVASATLIDGARLEANADAFVQNALALVQTTPEMEGLAASAVDRVFRFAEMLGDVRSALEIGKPARESARQTALSAIDTLRAEMIGARPSSLATALGLGW